MFIVFNVNPGWSSTLPVRFFNQDWVSKILRIYISRFFSKPIFISIVVGACFMRSLMNYYLNTTIVSSIRSLTTVIEYSLSPYFNFSRALIVSVVRFFTLRFCTFYKLPNYPDMYYFMYQQKEVLFSPKYSEAISSGVMAPAASTSDVCVFVR